MPATLAVRRPRPTKDAKEGSWPEPPPAMRETDEEEGDKEGFRYIILLGASRDTEGLVKGMEASAVLTKWVGSLIKCLAMVMISLFVGL